MDELGECTNNTNDDHGGRKLQELTNIFMA
jgi:hypothetical protein